MENILLLSLRLSLQIFFLNGKAEAATGYPLRDRMEIFQHHDESAAVNLSLLIQYSVSSKCHITSMKDDEFAFSKRKTIWIDSFLY